MLSLFKGNGFHETLTIKFALFVFIFYSIDSLEDSELCLFLTRTPGESKSIELNK